MQLDSYTRPHPDNWRIPVIDFAKVRADAAAALDYAYPGEEADELKAEIASWRDREDHIRLLMVKDYLVAMRNKHPHDDKPAGRAVRAYVRWIQTPPEKREHSLLIW